MFRREAWLARQEERRILQEIFTQQQRIKKVKEEVEEKQFSYRACLAEGCIIGRY